METSALIAVNLGFVVDSGVINRSQGLTALR